MTEEEKINGESNYSASNIQVLEGLELYVSVLPCTSATLVPRDSITWFTRL